MRENTINNIYSLQTIVVFSVVWFKSGVWWHGLVGAAIVLPMTAGLLQGLYSNIVLKIRGYRPQRYPQLFYFSAIVLTVYCFIF
tara:strand:+ start:105 stop:356 length:252 start_codon:yes stop_codon:yes gene_type:complete